MEPKNLTTGTAWKFIILLGIISLFSDMTHEGARTITGPFLGILGAGAIIVSTVAGLGEFLGYGVRFISGHLAERTKRYWPVTYVGYGVQMFSVPALALAGGWKVAALLILLERIGRAIRNPARDAMLSHVENRAGLLHRVLEFAWPSYGKGGANLLSPAGGSGRTWRPLSGIVRHLPDFTPEPKGCGQRYKC